MNRKTITSSGMEWTIISRNERETTHRKRHFFAARCNPTRPWKIREIDEPFSRSGCTRSLRSFGCEYETKQLTQAVMEICATTELRHAA